MARAIEKAIFGVLMVLVLGIGSVLVSAAVTNKNPVDLVSSIRVADPGDYGLQGISETEETAQLASLARITQEEAIITALSSTQGTFIAAELDNEDGNVVYSVEVEADGNVFDVKVDAGTGAVLKIEADNEDGPDEQEGSDAEQDGIDHQYEGDEGDHED